MAMSEQRRQLFLHICDGNPSTLAILDHCNHLSYCDPILKWLKANNIKGDKFMEFFAENQKDIIKTFQEVIRRIKKDPHTIPIFFGKDYF